MEMTPIGLLSAYGCTVKPAFPFILQWLMGTCQIPTLPLSRFVLITLLKEEVINCTLIIPGLVWREAFCPLGTSVFKQHRSAFLESKNNLAHAFAISVSYIYT
jgi:hypothetical protein